MSKSLTITLFALTDAVLALSLAYLFGAFVTMDMQWANWKTVQTWSDGDRAFFGFNAVMISGLGGLLGLMAHLLIFGVD